MQHLLNHMFYAMNRGQLNIGYAQLGYVTSVDASGYNIKVMLQPEEVETGFIPYGTPVYGWVAPPKGGELALVLFQGGKKNVPIAAMLLYWDQFRAPGVSSPGDTGAGEMLLKHSTGSYVKLTNDGKVLINGHVEIDVTTPTLNITTTGNVNLTTGGNLTATVTGNSNITSTGTATLQGSNTNITGGTVTLGDGTTATDALVKLNALITWANSHVHSDPQGGNTGTASPTLNSSVGTTVIRGA